MEWWDTSVEQAVALQRELASQVEARDGFDLAALKVVAGVDASYRDVSTAAVVVLSFPDLQVIEEAVATRQTAFPYIPGLLSFREIPALLDALAKLRSRPGLLVVDGHGLAHPRRFGIASHLGMVTGIPAIGCAKSRLTGTYEEPGPLAGDWSPLLDRRREVIGRVVRTKARTRPLFVSVGHRVSLETAVEIVLRCGRGYRLPEPTRLADRLSKRPVS
jgi:deoxyribonuclease V